MQACLWHAGPVVFVFVLHTCAYTHSLLALALQSISNSAHSDQDRADSYSSH
jgi:hypothetical protein